METRARIKEYMESVGVPEIWPPVDPLGDLLKSHARQREIIGEETDRRLRGHRRLRYLPFKLRCWLMGY
jgi:hypothetical protein